MSAAFDKLRSKLSELFQLDAAAELDFGIYRILNARRAEVQEFLDSLETQVDGVLAEALETGMSEWQAELEKVEAGLRAGGFAEDMIASAPRVRELREKIAHAAADPAVLARDIFSHLTTFFSRYYKDGDFLSLRRYKKDTYAIPYEGEEVKLHWANADQYYIKSSETLRDYTFRLGPAPKDPARADTRPAVTFKLVEADIEKDNAKAVAGQERRFVYQGLVSDPTGSDLRPDRVTSETSHSENSLLNTEKLILGFAYLPVGKKEKQADLNTKAAATILGEAAKGAFTALGQRDATYTGKKKEGRTTLDKHLAEYTGRNTFDYFIHKDLGGFLRRELDFYIKNEVVHLDDLEEAPEASWRETRAQLKALRAIAGKVIRFLAQLEDFQKRLWLKKKFVVGCDYVVTLDRVPEELYPEIAACEAQREEWVRLFGIDEVKEDLGRTGYSVPLTVEFLKENRGLPVDTRALRTSIRNERVAGEVASIAAMSSGLVVNGDNANGLRLIDRASTGEIDLCYIDPPYNTGNDGFAFKDQFRSSSWLAMLKERISIVRSQMSNAGSFWASIDDREVSNLRWCATEIFGQSSFVSDVAIVNNFKGRQDRDHIATAHEHLLLFMAPEFDSNGFPLSDAQVSDYSLEDEDGGKYQLRDLRKRGGNDSRTARPQLYFPLFWDPQNLTMSLTRNHEDEIEIYPVRSDGSDGCWRWGAKNVERNLEIIEARQVRETGKWNASYRVFLERDGEERTSKPKSIWLGSKYSSDRGRKELRKLFPDVSFVGPKSPELMTDVILHSTSPGDTTLDFFAGSGTTGHAVINLNREDGGDRKYILIEMGEHFDTVLVPRLKKVIYSKDWKDGKPQSRDTGVSHCFKILRLESYEDTLNNLRLHRSREQALALDALSPEAREQYRLGYQLDLESAGSQSLLNVSAFTDPWNYTLDVATGSAGETRPVKVDLVETFHWLLGLTVHAQGRGGGVHWTEGTNPGGEKVLVLWRNTTEVDADALNEWCRKQKIKVLDGEFALIYVNGDHHLENLRRDDQTWKVRLIDEEFPRLMWEGCE